MWDTRISGGTVLFIGMGIHPGHCIKVNLQETRLRYYSSIPDLRDDRDDLVWWLQGRMSSVPVSDMVKLEWIS